MPAPVTVNEFLEIARKSRVLNEVRLAEFFPDEADLPADPPACAVTLVKAGLLTKFQAKQLLAGRYYGLVVGNYRLLEPIGKGGMGVVYKAQHLNLPRLAALKILPPERARDQATLERFLREARSAAALDHRNIVQLYDVGHASGVHFLALEYVDGVTLDRVIESNGPVEFPTAIHYIVQVAAGLSHAHERGFVHRDIKPGNLILARDGTIKILDMGLARSLDREEDRLTEYLDGSTILGTVDFIAPEQALNTPTDARADIYSLGATLYALLTGRPPFEGNATQKLMQHQVRQADRLCDVNPAIPVDLSDVVDLMMTKRPQDRIPSAADVIRCLAPWLPDVPQTLALDRDTAASGAITAALTAVPTLRTTPVAAQPGLDTPEPSRPGLKLWPAAIVVGVVAIVGAVVWALFA
jgi:serine/threonine protein kinase